MVERGSMAGLGCFVRTSGTCEGDHAAHQGAFLPLLFPPFSLLPPPRGHHGAEGAGFFLWIPLCDGQPWAVCSRLAVLAVSEGLPPDYVSPRRWATLRYDLVRCVARWVTPRLGHPPSRLPPD